MTTDLRLVRTSERNDFKRCPWLWEQMWVKGLTTRRVPTWSWFGTAIHAGLEVWYKPGKKRGRMADVLDAFEASVGTETGKVYSAGGELDDDEVVDARKLGRAMLLGYRDHYGEDTQWEVIHSEQSFQIDVPHPTKPGKTLCVYAGTWDSLWRHRQSKELWLVDHKTRRSFPQNWSFYNINDQAGSYLWVAPEVLRHLGVLTKKDKIEGLIFNALRKHMPDERPRDEEGRARNAPKKEHFYEALKEHYDLNPNRLPAIAALKEMADEKGLIVLGDVSLRQPAPLYHREEIQRYDSERVTQAQRVQQEALWMQQILRGKLSAFKVPTEDCSRCKIFDYCELHEYDKEEAAEFVKQTMIIRDPYVDHREAMERGGVVL